MDSKIRDEILKYAAEQYGASPEYLWENDFDSAVLRHKGNNKWFALFMRVSSDRLGLDSGGIKDVLNVKCDSIMIGSFLKADGFLPAYHMNKNHWISILLDGSVANEQITEFLDRSYTLTLPKRKKTNKRDEK